MITLIICLLINFALAKTNIYCILSIALFFLYLINLNAIMSKSLYKWLITTTIAILLKILLYSMIAT